MFDIVDCSQSKALQKALGLGATAISLDIVTDVLSLLAPPTPLVQSIDSNIVLIIPVSLLWRVQIKPRQKLGLGVFLCLSVCMIIVAIIRIGGLHYHGAFDNTWIFLWQQVESCVAVAMVSLTAFRSVFVANASRRLGKKEVSPWLPYTPKVFRSHRKHASDEQALDELTIPSATMTGMRTFIGGDREKPSRTGTEVSVSDGWSPHDNKQSTMSHSDYNSTPV